MKITAAAAAAVTTGILVLLHDALRVKALLVVKFVDIEMKRGKRFSLLPH